MITELTNEQKSQFDKYVEKWTKVGTSTKPINFEKAKAAVKKAYEIAGVKVPETFIYCKSPLSAQFYINILQNLKIDMKSVKKDISQEVMKYITKKIEDNVIADIEIEDKVNVIDSISNDISDSILLEFEKLTDKNNREITMEISDKIEAVVSDNIMESSEMHFNTSSEMFSNLNEKINNNIPNEIEDVIIKATTEKLKPGNTNNNIVNTDLKVGYAIANEEIRKIKEKINDIVKSIIMNNIRNKIINGNNVYSMNEHIKENFENIINSNVDDESIINEKKAGYKICLDVTSKCHDNIVNEIKERIREIINESVSIEHIYEIRDIIEYDISNFIEHNVNDGNKNNIKESIGMSISSVAYDKIKNGILRAKNPSEHIINIIYSNIDDVIKKNINDVKIEYCIKDAVESIYDLSNENKLKMSGKIGVSQVFYNDKNVSEQILNDIGDSINIRIGNHIKHSVICCIDDLFKDISSSIKKDNNLDKTISNNTESDVNKMINEKVDNNIILEIYNNISNKVSKIIDKSLSQIINQIKEDETLYDKLTNGSYYGIAKKIDTKVVGEIKNGIIHKIENDIIFDINNTLENTVNEIDKLKNDINHDSKIEIENNMGSKLMSEIISKISSSIEVYTKEYISDMLIGSIYKIVIKKIYDSINNSINDIIKNNEMNYVSTWFYGQHDASWISFYDYIENCLGLKEETKKMEGLKEIVLKCGWCYCYENIVFICDRHSKLNMDENNNLHSENDYAFQYPDGYGECFWHGTKIPNWIILQPEKLTVDEIFKEKNKEVQRCMIEIYGRDKLIAEEGKLIHSDDWGDLYEISQFHDSFDKPLRFIKVINFSPNETTYLKKETIDKIMIAAQQKIGTNGMYRHGDVVIISKNAKQTTKEEAEQMIREYKAFINQALDIECNKQKITYKEYFLQINPNINTAYEAWQSCHSKLDLGNKIKQFLPFVAS